MQKKSYTWIWMLIVFLLGFLLWSFFFRLHIWTQTDGFDTLEPEIKNSCEEMQYIYEILESNYYQWSGFVFDLTHMTDESKKAFVNGLDDAYTEYLTKADWELFLEGMNGQTEIVWIWAILEKEDDWTILIVDVLDDSPAKKTWIQWWDIITAVDWISVLDEDLDSTVDRIKWEKWSMVVLSITRNQDSDSVDFEAEVIRDDVVIKSVWVDTINTDGYNIANIGISMIWDHTSSIFKKEIAKLKDQDIDWIILDLRWNAGWYMDWAVEIASYFIPKWEIVVTAKYKWEPDEVWKSEWYEWIQGLPTIVLIDENTASAWEIIAIALDKEPWIQTLWAKTYGKGSIQIIEEVKQWSLLKFTMWLRYDKDWHNINNIWFNPTIPVELNIQEYLEWEDSQLNAALDKIIWNINN